MRKLLFLPLLLVPISVKAQTHTFCASDTNCNYTGNNTFVNINSILYVGTATGQYATIAAAQTACPSAGCTIYVTQSASTLDSSTITITKPIHVIFDAASYSSSATGSLFACTAGTEGVHIEGSNRGGAGITQGTLINLTNNATIGFNFTNCPGALIEKLTLLGPNAGGTGKGIILSGTRPILRQLLVSQFGSDGVTIDGTTNNTNLAEINHVRAQNNGGHGFKTLGTNANVILFNGADAGGNIGDGFNINTAGNVFLGTNTSGNGTGGVGNGYHFLSGANNNWGMPFSDAPNGNENVGYRFDSGANNNVLFTTADAGAAPIVNNGSGNRYFSSPSVMSAWNAVTFGAGDGSVATPSYNFQNETGSGWYRAAATDIRLSLSGTDHFRELTTGPILASGDVLAFGSSGVGSPDTGLSRDAAGVVDVGNGVAGNATGTIKTGKYATGTNCAVNSVSPAACGSSASGAFVIPTTTTSYTVNTTAVTAASRIFLFPMSFAGNLPSSPTCVVPAITAEPTISAISAGTSFTMTEASTTGQTCWQFLIVN